MPRQKPAALNAPHTARKLASASSNARPGPACAATRAALSLSRAPLSPAHGAHDSALRVVSGRRPAALGPAQLASLFDYVGQRARTPGRAWHVTQPHAAPRGGRAAERSASFTNEERGPVTALLGSILAVKRRRAGHAHAARLRRGASTGREGAAAPRFRASFVSVITSYVLHTSTRLQTLFDWVTTSCLKRLDYSTSGLPLVALRETFTAVSD